MKYRENGRDFDGFIFEVHPNPSVAWTDAKQQLTWEQFDTLMEEYSTEQVKKNNNLATSASQNTLTF